MTFPLLGLAALVFVSPVQASVQRENSVELQWSLCEPSANQFFQKAKVSSGSENRRTVYYRETEGMDLYQRESFIRTRLESGSFKRAVKVKYTDEQQIPWDNLDSWGVECEKDVYTSQFKWGCSLKTKPLSAVADLSQGEEEYLAAETGFQNFSQLKIWGPVDSSEWKFRSVRSVNLTLETLKGPLGYFSMELSAKVKLSEEATVSRQIQSWIQSKNLILCPVQQGKTGDLLKALMKARSDF